eukprot:Blabericola_migrator_1__13104@NODE_891_length_6160_cov_27_099787_g627_i0_p1_GENE_NODE_891_length_6160_cov_27_099787_g627_i0NODE_891_length_6160_cov_27_099787_g627_i0_p1_ORF_typecomplete_len790_score95_50_NODE_891_length_6160_cov_27_099787_g627_i016023971
MRRMRMSRFAPSGAMKSGHLRRTAYAVPICVISMLPSTINPTVNDSSSSSDTPSLHPTKNNSLEDSFWPSIESAKVNTHDPAFKKYAQKLLTWLLRALPAWSVGDDTEEASYSAELLQSQQALERFLQKPGASMESGAASSRSDLTQCLLVLAKLYEVEVDTTFSLQAYLVQRYLGQSDLSSLCCWLANGDFELLKGFVAQKHLPDPLLPQAWEAGRQHLREPKNSEGMARLSVDKWQQQMLTTSAAEGQHKGSINSVASEPSSPDKHFSETADSVDVTGVGPLLEDIETLAERRWEEAYKCRFYPTLEAKGKGNTVRAHVRKILPLIRDLPDKVGELERHTLRRAQEIALWLQGRDVAIGETLGLCHHDFVRTFQNGRFWDREDRALTAEARAAKLPLALSTAEVEQVIKAHLVKAKVISDEGEDVFVESFLTGCLRKVAECYGVALDKPIEHGVQMECLLGRSMILSVTYWLARADHQSLNTLYFALLAAGLLGAEATSTRSLSQSSQVCTSPDSAVCTSPDSAVCTFWTSLDESQRCTGEDFVESFILPWVARLKPAFIGVTRKALARQIITWMVEVPSEKAAQEAEGLSQEGTSHAGRLSRPFSRHLEVLKKFQGGVFDSMSASSLEETKGSSNQADGCTPQQHCNPQLSECIREVASVHGLDLPDIRPQVAIMEGVLGSSLLLSLCYWLAKGDIMALQQFSDALKGAGFNACEPTAPQVNAAKLRRTKLKVVQKRIDMHTVKHGNGLLPKHSFTFCRMQSYDNPTQPRQLLRRWLSEPIVEEIF